MRKVVVPIVLAAAVVATAAPPASAAFPGSGGRMLYAEDTGGGGFDLRAIRTGTGATSPVLAGAGNAPIPGGISPNGKRIAYFSNAGGDNEIWIAKIDGSDAHPITTNAVNDQYPRWSPDGSKIVYATDGDLAVMDVDGSDSVVIRPALVIVQPTWSPRGNRIAFSELGSPGTLWDTLSIKPDGSGVKILAGAGYNEILGDYSPDGRSIVYYRPYGSGAFAIFRMSAKGTDKHPLIVNGDNDLTFPQYSSDGERILYQRYEGVFTDVWSARASDGRKRTELLANATNNYLAYMD